MDSNVVSNDNAIKANEGEITRKEKHTEIMEGAVFRAGVSSKEIYEKLLTMPEVDIEARIAEIQEELRTIAEETRNGQVEFRKDSVILSREMDALELFPRVKVTLEMLQGIKKRMLAQKSKKIKEAREKLELKEQDAEIASDNISLLDSIEERIRALTKNMKTLKTKDPNRTELLRRIKHLDDMRREMGDRAEWEKTIQEAKEAREAIDNYEAKCPENIVAKRCETPWETIFNGMQFIDIVGLSEQEIQDRLGMNKEEKPKENKTKKVARTTDAVITIENFGKNDKTSTKQEESNNETQSISKTNKISQILVKVPVVRNIINRVNQFIKKRKTQEPVLDKPKRIETEREIQRKEIMAKAIESSSKTLMENEADFRELLSQEEYQFYLKTALQREELRQKEEMAIDAKVSTYTDIIEQKKNNKNQETKIEEEITEEQKLARAELRKTVMAEAMQSSTQALRENELEIRKVLSEEEFNWYLKQAMKREDIENIRQTAIEVKNSLQKPAINQGMQTQEGDEVSFGSRRKDFVQRMSGTVGGSVSTVKTGENQAVREPNGERIA